MSDDRLVGNADGLGIAIIGMAGRFPGAANLDVLWRNLLGGAESISQLSEDDLRASGVPNELLSDPAYVKVCASIDGAQLFDADYFKMSSKEAEYIDPQHRLFLETAVEALEDAGCDSHRYPGSIGVFGGANLNLHQYLMIHDELRSNGAKGVFHLLERLGGNTMAVLGGDKDYLTTRTSYKLNLRGPSVTVQTACSTSLVAVHLACQSLLLGECDVALAGGVSISTGSYRRTGYLPVQGMTSPDGHCRPFDSRANGTVFGDGVGIIVLKRVDRAIADGDCIRAVIRGSAINNDGSTKVGYTAPSVDAQTAVVVEALTVAGISADSVSYVEAHGTGTPLGDPIEVAALSNAFGVSTTRRNFCGIGSVKANLGHLNTAAGIAGLMKVVLALQNKCLPPTINFTEANPAIEFASSPFYVVTQPTRWSGLCSPRRAGVSALGIGGTNAHVVLEEAPPRQVPPSRRSTYVLPLSARTSSALDAAARDLAVHLRRHSDVAIPDVAYTLSVGRMLHRHRRAIVCGSREEGLLAIESNDRRHVHCGVQDAGATVFAFPGQGSQHLNMGRSLYSEEKVFRSAIDNCADLLLPYLNHDIRALIWPRNGHGDTEILAETGVAQPVIFSMSYALAKLWMSWGVRPQAMIGHSLGELVAACIAGVFTIEDALTAVAARASLMQAMPRGGMLAVSAPAEALRECIGFELCVAAINAPDTCVVAGPFEAIASFAEAVRAQGMLATRLETSHAFHSPMMAPMVETFVERLRRMTLKAPSVPFISNVSGTWIKPGEATDPSYWGRHILSAVRFADGMKTVLAEGAAAILEVGPGRTLTSIARHNASTDSEVDFIASLPQPDGTSAEAHSIARALAQLWVRGAPVEWEELYRSERRLKVSLPTYPFEREDYRVVPSGQAEHKEASGRTIRREGSPEPKAITEVLRTLSWKYVRRRSMHQVATVRSRSCLVFAADDALSKQLVQTLRGGGAAVSVASIAERYEALGGGCYTLRPDEPEHFARLWSELTAAGKTPQTVIYTWSVLNEEDDGDDQGPALDRAFYGLIYLLQAMGSAGQDTPIELTVIVAETHDILGNETILPTAATALGPCLVASAEYDHIKCRYVDVPRLQHVGLAERLVGDLDDWSVGPVVAYRGARRWIPLAEPLTVESREAGSPLRQDGVYVITGGLGEIGLEVAGAFAGKARVKLALVGRSGLPDRGEWESLEQARAPEKTAGIIRRIRAIEAKGADVMVVRADVGDLESMRAAIEAIRGRFGAVHGVVHAAGLLDAGLIEEKTRSNVDPVLSAKIAGARLIDRLLQDVELDFIVLFSSVGSMTCRPGMVGYRAANAYLDAFARSDVPHHAGKIIAINWGVWSEMGMAARGRSDNDLSTQEGLDALFRILQGSSRQVIVTKAYELFTPVQEPRVSKPAEQEAERTIEGKRRYSRPNLSTPYVEPRSELERVVADVWSDALLVENVGINDDFFELGGHSLLALQLIPRVQRRFRIKLSAAEFFDANTVAACAEIIESKLIEELEQAEGV